MKKMFTEPEIEILTFLCDTGYNSEELGGTPGEGGDLGDDNTILGQ